MTTRRRPSRGWVAVDAEFAVEALRALDLVDEPGVAAARDEALRLVVESPERFREFHYRREGNGREAVLLRTVDGGYVVAGASCPRDAVSVLMTGGRARDQAEAFVVRRRELLAGLAKEGVTS